MNFGDRAPTTICRFPPDAFYHHGKGGCVLDVTQAPFFAKGDGIADDTAALMAAMSFVRSHREVVSRHGKTVCNPKYNSNWIIYLPAGIYSVRDTISQGWPALAMNTRGGWDHVKYFQVSSPQEEVRLRKQPSVDRPFLHGMPELTARDDDHGRFAHGQYNYAEIYSEVNWNIRIFGESRENTIIRLRDETPGFGAGNARSVLSFFLLERGSNINLGNFLENLTIDTGCGNPGAVALRWNSSNWGGVRNVCLRSGDGQGATAMKLDCNNVTGYCRDMVLDGFETGIELAAGRETMLVLEHAT
ncbi:MAG: hypothetical protein IKO65_06215, partial [Victivallales bacterium]|nr:hypothetical protein [Victivallales bacterium]